MLAGVSEYMTNFDSTREMSLDHWWSPSTQGLGRKGGAVLISDGCCEILSQSTAFQTLIPIQMQ